MGKELVSWHSMFFLLFPFCYILQVLDVMPILVPDFAYPPHDLLVSFATAVRDHRCFSLPLQGSGKHISNQQHSLDFKSGLVPGQICSATAKVVIYKSECFQRIAADPHGAFLEYTKRIQCGNSNTTTGRTKDIYMHEQWWIGHLAGLEIADAPSSSEMHESDSSDTETLQAVKMKKAHPI
ncbi:hypothetical protein ACSBR2_020505 [Camellia fascicularis]